MRGHYTESEAGTIRAFVGERRRRKGLDLEARLLAARSDCKVIVSAIAREQHPLADPAALSAVRSSALKLTLFPLDIVAIEHMHPAYADHIRRRGKVVYERQGT